MQLLQREIEETVGRSGRRVEKIETSLEDVFIYLMGRSEKNSGGNA